MARPRLAVPTSAWLCLVMAVLASPLSAAPSRDPEIHRLDGSTIAAQEVDATVTRLLHDARVTAAGIAIFNDGRVVYEKAYGLRDVDAALPLTVDTVMTAASLSKAAFASMVMQLVDEGARPRIGLLIMTNSANGESIYQELLETLIRNRFTPIEWERFTPYKKTADTQGVSAGGKVHTR